MRYTVGIMCSVCRKRFVWILKFEFHSTNVDQIRLICSKLFVWTCTYYYTNYHIVYHKHHEHVWCYYMTGSQSFLFIFFACLLGTHVNDVHFRTAIRRRWQTLLIGAVLSSSPRHHLLCLWHNCVCSQCRNPIPGYPWPSPALQFCSTL